MFRLLRPAIKNRNVPGNSSSVGAEELGLRFLGDPHGSVGAAHEDLGNYLLIVAKPLV